MLSERLAGLGVPSNICAVFAVGHLAFLIADKNSAAAQVVEHYRCGAVIGAGESEHLVEIITGYAANRSEREELERAARQVFDARFYRSHGVRAYRQSFMRALNIRRLHKDR